MSDATTDTIIATIPKNTREELRVSLSEFKGHKLCQLRAWITDGDIPTKNGFGIQVTLIPSLIAALQDAEAEGQRRGWVPAVAHG
jgi:hypothetical protein